MVSKVFKADDNEVFGGGNNKANETIINLSKNNKSRSLTYILNIKAISKSTFLTFNIKKIFNHLWRVFIQSLIFQNFDLESHI